MNKCRKRKSCKENRDRNSSFKPKILTTNSVTAVNRLIDSSENKLSTYLANFKKNFRINFFKKTMLAKGYSPHSLDHASLLKYLSS